MTHFYPSDAHREAPRRDESDPRHIAAGLLADERRYGAHGWRAAELAMSRAADSATRHLSMSARGEHESAHASLAMGYAQAWELLGSVKSRAIQAAVVPARRRLDSLAVAS